MEPSRAAPRHHRGLPLTELVLLAVAVVAVSTSAPLIRGAAAPTLAIAFWRNAMSIPLVGGWVGLRPSDRAGWRQRDQRERRLSTLAGVLLAVHFATWIPSLSFTTVASSVALVATQPVWAALIAHRRGEHVNRGTWVGISLAIAGAVVLTGIDVSISARAVFGDVLALVGGMLAAAYVTVGAEVRRTVATGPYALSCYSTAAAVLLLVSVVGRQSLWGYDAGTWWAIVGLVIGAQMLGHTLLNRVLRSISPTIVSVAILFEILGASLIAQAAFGESPPAGAWLAALLIGAGVVVVVRSQDDASDLVEPEGVIT